MDDAAADYQMAYDQAVHQYGVDSPEAQAAEREARKFFYRFAASDNSSNLATLEHLA